MYNLEGKGRDHFDPGKQEIQASYEVMNHGYRWSIWNKVIYLLHILKK